METLMFYRHIMLYRLYSDRNWADKQVCTGNCRYAATSPAVLTQSARSDRANTPAVFTSQSERGGYISLCWSRREKPACYLSMTLRKNMFRNWDAGRKRCYLSEHLESWHSSHSCSFSAT